LKAMKTGQPILLREGKDFDVTLPLHDAAGRTIGAIGLTFKPLPGEQDPDATRRARAMAGQIEKQIASAEQLFQRNAS